MRAIWVTRFDYRTPADIQRIMENCDNLGMTAVFFQVRGNGTAFYRSQLEPWADELGGRDPGFDPLAVAVVEAHARGLQLHAWVNVMPGWQGPDPPRNSLQLYHARPEWFWYDQRGARQPLVQVNEGRREGWYVSVNPCLPDVRQYLVSVFQEIVQGYDVDGLHMDYIRFPNETAARGVDYPYDKRTLSLYRSQTGRTPSQSKGRWTQWRTEQVSAVVRETRAMMRRVRPRAVLSTAVGPDPDRARSEHYQDGETWARNGWIDFLCPMNYTADEQLFVRRAHAWRGRAHGRPVLMGLGLFLHKTTAPTLRQLELAEGWRQGFCLFSYVSLCTSPDEKLRQGATDQLRRERVAVVQKVAVRMIGR